MSQPYRALLLAPALAVFAAGCVNTIRFPPDLWNDWWWTGDTGWDRTWTWDTSDTSDTGALPTSIEDLPVGVSLVYGGCNDDDTLVQFTAVTDGWTGDVLFDVYRGTGETHETHEMRVRDADPSGQWQEWSISLVDGATSKDHVPGVNTQYDCADADKDVAFGIRIQDEPGTTNTCVVWGARQVELTLELIESEPNVGTIGCQSIEL